MIYVKCRASLYIRELRTLQTNSLLVKHRPHFKFWRIQRNTGLIYNWFKLVHSKNPTYLHLFLYIGQFNTSGHRTRTLSHSKRQSRPDFIEKKATISYGYDIFGVTLKRSSDMYKIDTTEGYSCRCFESRGAFWTMMQLLRMKSFAWYQTKSSEMTLSQQNYPCRKPRTIILI